MKLLPKQQKARDAVIDNLSNSNIFIIRGASGAGKTVVLESIAEKISAKIITIKDIVDVAMDSHPLKWEESFYSLLSRAYKKESIIIVDDIDLIYNLNKTPGNQRANIAKAILETIKKVIYISNKKLIATTTDKIPDELSEDAAVIQLPPIESGDLEILIRYNVDIIKQSELDAEKIVRFAPGLSSHQISNITRMFSHKPSIDTISVIKAINDFYIQPSQSMAKPEMKTPGELFGCDKALDIIKNKIVEPINSRAQIVDNYYSDEPEKKPEKARAPHPGVLVFGHEGSGKTLLGKILAGLLHERFSFLSGGIFNKENIAANVKDAIASAESISPSALFLDDMDIFLDANSESFSPELANYLKFYLDGICRQKNLPVSVILTTSDPKKLPSYLLRTGRFDLHIEMQTPDEKTRESIFRKEFSDAKINIDNVTILHLSEETESFTYNDCKRLVKEVTEEISKHTSKDKIDIVDLMSKKVISIKRNWE